MKETQSEKKGKAIGFPIKRKNEIEIEKKLIPRKNRRKEEMPMGQQKRINKRVWRYVIKCLEGHC
jgi:hypothetical protein